MNEIFIRRSLRKFKDETVEDEKIDKIIRAIFQAPSSLNQQSCEVICVRDKEIKEKLAGIWDYTRPCNSANVVLALVANSRMMKDPTSWQQDLSANAQNGLLQVVSEGLGAVWMGICPDEGAMKSMAEILNLPADIFPFCLIAIGYSEKENQFIDRYDPKKVHFNLYDNNGK